MSIVTQRYMLGVSPGSNSPRIRCSMGDTARDIKLLLHDSDGLFSIPNYVSAVVKGTKSNNVGFLHSCIVGDNYVVFTIVEDMSDIPGVVTCEIQLTDSNGGIIGTSNFVIQVENPALSDDSDIGDVDTDIITGIITDIEVYKSLVNKVVADYKDEVDDAIDGVVSAVAAHGTAIQNIQSQQSTFESRISGQMDAFIAGNSGNYGRVTLWESQDANGIIAKDTVITLSEAVESFDYVDIYSFDGDRNAIDIIPVDAILPDPGYTIRWTNVSTQTVKFDVIETRLTISGTVFTIANQYQYQAGQSTPVHQITQSNMSNYVGQFGILKVVGRKLVENAEVVDMRVGADGVTYQSAGAAVRTQFRAVNNKTASNIPYNNTNSGLVATNVQDAIDENAEELAGVNGRLDQMGNTEITVLDALVPVGIFDGTIDSTGRIQNNTNGAYAVYKCEKDKSYDVASASNMNVFTYALFNEFPFFGNTPLINGDLSLSADTPTTIFADGEYMAVQFYDSALDTRTAEEIISDISVVGVITEEEGTVTVAGTLSAYIYGAGQYPIQSSASDKIAYYEIEPNTNYILRSVPARVRFRLGQYTSVPTVNAKPISGTYLSKDGESSVTFTSVSTAQYMAVWFYCQSQGDSDTVEEALSGLTLVNDDFVPPEQEMPTADDTFESAFKKISANTNAIQCVAGKGVISPAYIFNGYIDLDATGHPAKASDACRIAAYPVEPNRLYKVVCTTVPARMRIGCFTANIGANVTPTSFHAPIGCSEYYFKTDADTKIVGIYYFDSSKGDTDADAVLSGIKLVGPTVTSIEESVSVANEEIENLITKDTFNIVAWNIGHFSMGKNQSSNITTSNYVSKLKGFCDIINGIDADLIALSEYSSVFLPTGSIKAEDVIFPAFKEHYIGEQRRYSCNAIYSNLHMRGPALCDFDSLAGETISHTTLITAQDYYYIKTNVVIGGRDTVVIPTHFAFDNNRPQVLQQKQIAELIQICTNDPYVIILGDLNTSNAETMAAFTDAGYTVAPILPVPYQFMDDLTYIVVKGFDVVEVSSVYASKNLSDHTILCAKVRPN